MVGRLSLLPPRPRGRAEYKRNFLHVAVTAQNRAMDRDGKPNTNCLAKLYEQRLLNDSMNPFSQGLPGATGIDSAPLLGSQLRNASQMNSEPLSLRIRLGVPWRPITRASTQRTSAPLRA
jgi:hypothetical protein